VSKLQQEYLRHREHAHSTEVLPRSEDIRNKRFGGKVSTLFRGRREDLQDLKSAKPAKPEEGMADITRGFQISLPSQTLN
jgi:hypothetical protein